jgi:hypothetical protein
MADLSIRDILDRTSCGRRGCPSMSTAKNGKATTHCPNHNDRGPSLSVKQSGNRVLLNCFGCNASYAEIMATLRSGNGYRQSAATCHEERGQRSRHTSGEAGHVVAEYEYHDETGRLLYVKERHEPKDFKLRRPNGTGGWIYGRGAISPVPYRLHELVATPPDAIVFIAGGEKGANALVARGAVATCCPDGDTSWDAAWAGYFRDRTVIVAHDADPSGRDLGERIAHDLAEVARVYVIEPAGLAEHEDVFDFLDRGGTVDQLLRQALRAGESRPAPAPKPPDGDHTDCRQTIERLERRCENARRRAVARGTELRNEKAKGRATMQVLGNKGASAGQRLTAIGLVYHVTGDERRGAADAANRTHISSTQLAELTGQSAASVRDHIKTFATIGACTRKVTRTYDAETDKWQSELRAGFADGGATVAQRLSRFAAIDLQRERKPGTGHPKPVCPDCNIELEPAGWRCRSCGSLFDDVPAAESAQNGNFSTSEAAGESSPYEDPRTYTRNFSTSEAPPACLHGVVTTPGAVCHQCGERWCHECGAATGSVLRGVCLGACRRANKAAYAAAGGGD